MTYSQAVAVLVAVMEQVEFEVDVFTVLSCPWCNGASPNHTPDCSRQAALAAAGEAVADDALLRKYMRYVQEVEGADFVGHSNRRWMGHPDVKFTEEEWATLERISTEASAERHHG
jgi:hypothetical protein